MPATPEKKGDTPSGDGHMHEIRLYGLHSTITADQLTAFFSFGVRVLGVTLHPGQEGLQWAKMWVGSEREVQSCMEKKLKLAENGITITRAPTTPGLMTPDSTRRVPVAPFASPARAEPMVGVEEHSRWRKTSSTSQISLSGRSDSGGLGYRHVDPSGPLPRNLYVMGLPLDLTQVQFKERFTVYGMVEHSILLSQLDSMGRRRGFVLMSTHREALQALTEMNGTYVEGLKIDVSWALRQKEAQQIGSGITGLGNRVLHPPSTPVRKEATPDCMVVCDNLDPAYFPHIDRLRDVLEVYGPIQRVNLLAARPSVKVLIQFEHAVSAQALIESSGSIIAGRPIIATAYSPSLTALTPSPNNSVSSIWASPASQVIHTPASFSTIPRAFQFDPFRDQDQPSPIGFGNTSQLNAGSHPFVPPITLRAPSCASDTIKGGSAALSRISSRSTSTGQSQTAHSASGSGTGSSSNGMTKLESELKLAEIWH